MKIGAVLLAAGRSKRFGESDKLLALIDGVPLVRRALAALEASVASDIVVVTLPGADRLIEAAGRGRWRFIENGDADSGMASSLRVGLANIDAACAGALIALADMPMLSAAIVDDVCAAFANCNGEAIVFPESPDGRQGHPVLWPRAHFERLSALDGDQGGKSVLLAHREAWHPVPIAADAAFIDIDTPADLKSATQRKGD